MFIPFGFGAFSVYRIKGFKRVLQILGVWGAGAVI